MSTSQDPKATAIQLNEEDRCIVCREQKKSRKRGLCIADYERYRRAKTRVNREELQAWEDDLIARGLILPDARSSGDPFMQTLLELRQKHELERMEQAEESAKEAVRDHGRLNPPAKKAPAKRRKKSG